MLKVFAMDPLWFSVLTRYQDEEFFSTEYFGRCNNIFYAMGMLDTAIRLAYKESINVLDALFRTQSEDGTMPPDYYACAAKMEFYERGLAILQSCNPNIKLLTPSTYLDQAGIEAAMGVASLPSMEVEEPLPPAAQQLFSTVIIMGSVNPTKPTATPSVPELPG